jgi:hypothetical protein
MEKSAGIWVRMPRYSSNDGVVVNYRIPFYSPAIPLKNEVDSSKVWTNKNDVLVFHMNPTGRLYDVAHGQTLGLRVKEEIRYERAGAYPVPCAGPTGPYQAYHSTTNARQDSTLTFALSSPLTNVWTVSWWAKEDEDEFAAPKKETYVWTIKDMSLLKGSGYSGHGTSGNKMALYNGGKGCNLEIPDTAWHHYAYAADGVNVYCYRDGELMKTSQWSKNFAFNEQFSGAVRLMSSSNAGKDAFRGCADEFRLESACRGADWIRASYLNQLAWRNGTPWQFAPHFTGISGEVSDDGKLRAEAALSCRTAAAITFYWGESDGGERPEMWRIPRNSVISMTWNRRWCPLRFQKPALDTPAGLERKTSTERCGRKLAMSPARIRSLAVSKRRLPSTTMAMRFWRIFRFVCAFPPGDSCRMTALRFPFMTRRAEVLHGRRRTMSVRIPEPIRFGFVCRDFHPLRS